MTSEHSTRPGLANAAERVAELHDGGGTNQELWSVLRTGTGWTDLPEAAGHYAELRRIYTNKDPDQCVVLKDSVDYNLIVKSGKDGAVFMLVEYVKMFGQLEVKRISLVKPTTNV